MKKLYFISTDAISARSVKRHLEELELGDWQLNIFSQTSNNTIVRENLIKAQINRRSKRSSSENSAKVGLASALAASFSAVTFLPLLDSVGKLVYASLVFVCSVVGAWAGGIFNQDASQHGVKPFIDNLHSGNYVIIVDVLEAYVELVVEAVAHYPEVSRVEKGLHHPSNQPKVKAVL